MRRYSGSKPTSETKRMGLGLRPARVAVLIGAGATRAEQTDAALALTEVWGGPSCALIPTDGTTIEPFFWKLLRFFDPDLVSVYGQSVTVAAPLLSELYARLSLLDVVGRHHGYIWRGNCGYPLTSVDSVLAAMPGPPEFTVPHVIDLEVVTNDELALQMLAAETGLLSAERRQRLRDLDVPLDPARLDFMESPGTAVSPPSSLWPLMPGNASCYPISLAYQELATYSSWPTPSQVLVVCGDTWETSACTGRSEARVETSRELTYSGCLHRTNGNDPTQGACDQRLVLLFMPRHGV